MSHSIIETELFNKCSFIIILEHLEIILPAVNEAKFVTDFLPQPPIPTSKI